MLGLLFYVLSLCIYTNLTIKQLLPANVYHIISHCIILPLPTITLITAHLHTTLHPHCQQLHWLLHTFTSRYTHTANNYTDYRTPSHHTTPTLLTITLITVHLHIMIHPHCQQLHWLLHTFTSCYTHTANNYTDYCTPSHHTTPTLPTNTLITAHLHTMLEPFFSKNTPITAHLHNMLEPFFSKNTLITVHLHNMLHPHCQPIQWLLYTFTTC